MAQIEFITIYAGYHQGAGAGVYENAVFRLRNYTAGPTGSPGSSSVLATATVDVSRDWPPGVNGPKVITFASPATVTSSGFYCLEIDCTGMTPYNMSVYFYIGRNPTDFVYASSEPYASKEGAQYYWLNALSTWNLQSTTAGWGYDCYSGESWGNEATESVTYARWSIVVDGNFRSKGAIRFYLDAGGDPPSKATNPSPSDETENDGCFDNKLSWSGDGDGYDVYIGTSAETLGIIASGTTSNPYTVSEEDFPTNSTVYWRIDSNNDAGTTEGDVWSFDPSPGAVSNPTPNDGQGRVSTNQSRLYWDGGKLYQTFDVYIDGYLAEEDTTNEYYDLNDYDYWPLLGGTAYTWSVTAKNAHGETEGDTWAFTTGARYAPITPRPLDYDEDMGWNVPNGEWAPIGDLDVAGGGSLQSQIIVIGHKTIYFGSL